MALIHEPELWLVVELELALRESVSRELELLTTLPHTFVQFTPIKAGTVFTARFRILQSEICFMIQLLECKPLAGLTACYSDAATREKRLLPPFDRSAHNLMDFVGQSRCRARARGLSRYPNGEFVAAGPGDSAFAAGNAVVAGAPPDAEQRLRRSDPIDR